ncbi:hypothetical protein, partial [Enterococcus faecium]|uniref:hypothetical protein n=1 Tax=Enterococcus faecium TaxID=1352 RepID=UPI0022E3BB4F
SVFELPTVTLIPNGIHHPPIEDGRLLPNSVQEFQKTVPYLARHISFPYCFTSFLSIFDKLIVISYSGGSESTSNPTDSKG